MDFFWQKVVTTGVVFDMCELCYSSWIHFQEHCFPCPLFQITQPSIEPTYLHYQPSLLEMSYSIL